MSENPPLLEFDNVSISRGEGPVLHSISLRIDEGEHVAVLGPNGSGKSTLIKAITRECYPLQSPPGSLRVMGKRRWNLFDLRAILGIVTNDLISSCSHQYTGREVVLSGFFGSVAIYPDQHHVTPAMEEKADEILDLLEIPHLANRYVQELSSGEARRVVIGRCLVHNPKALILDEPTTSLDLRATYEFREAVRKLARGGITIVMVTHHLPDIIPEMQRLILMREGRIFRDGPKDELLTSATLEQMFGIPVQVGQRDGYYHLY